MAKKKTTPRKSGSTKKSSNTKKYLIAGGLLAGGFLAYRKMNEKDNSNQAAAENVVTENGQVATVMPGDPVPTNSIPATTEDTDSSSPQWSQQMIDSVIKSYQNIKKAALAEDRTLESKVYAWMAWFSRQSVAQYPQVPYFKALDFDATLVLADGKRLGVW